MTAKTATTGTGSNRSSAGRRHGRGESCARTPAVVRRESRCPRVAGPLSDIFLFFKRILFFARVSVVRRFNNRVRKRLQRIRVCRRSDRDLILVFYNFFFFNFFSRTCSPVRSFRRRNLVGRKRVPPTRWRTRVP